MPNPEMALLVLRKKMQEKYLDYYLVGSSDPHNNEYVPAHWQYLFEVSGFSGSLGYLLVSHNFAGLWVDSRYHVQADRECSTQIEIFRIGQCNVPLLHEYWQQLLDNSEKPLQLGFDGSCFSYGSLKKLLSVTSSANGLADGKRLLIDELWSENTEQTETPFLLECFRPPLPKTFVYSYKIEYCGQNRLEKIKQVRQSMYKFGYDYYPIMMLDNIAWLLNVRASDIDYSPLPISYLLLGQNSLCWYIETDRICSDLAHELSGELKIKPYSQFYEDCRILAALPATRFLLSEHCNMQLLDILLFNRQVAACTENPRAQKAQQNNWARDIINDMKTIKNPTEQEQLRKIMSLDGAAMVAFHTWLRPQNALCQGTVEGSEINDQAILNEYKLGQKITQCRKQIAGEYGRGESFEPIVGVADNSALPHYSAGAETSRSLQKDGQNSWILLDSGGQYLGGTTDMTRCFALSFAAPRLRPDSPDLRFLYTLVLRGHLQLQNAHFPAGTVGAQLDTLARNPLWSESLNYHHGTGHGVGNFLNVHEWPVSISPLALNEPLKAGMLLSNEPGFYLEGHFGIRIENLLLVQEDRAKANWLYFEPISMFPYERELICIEELSKQETQWIDDYHALCLKRILSCHKLNAEQEAWLRWRCAPLKTF